jgi:DNA-binding XRE family transcriptional regulator
MDAKKTGELIAALRKEKGWSQTELAERLGVTNKAVSRWETGRGYPDVEFCPCWRRSWVLPFQSCWMEREHLRRPRWRNRWSFSAKAPDGRKNNAGA